MARPKKLRQVCCLPRHTAFVPLGETSSVQAAAVMTVEEYETIRLIDHEGLTQADCAKEMKIARTTVQQIYTDARKKLAVSLVEGRPLWIQGGQYHICGEGKGCCGRCGHQHCCCQAILAEKQEMLADAEKSPCAAKLCRTDIPIKEDNNK